MDHKRIKPASQRFGLLAELGVNAAASGGVEKNAGGIDLMSQTKARPFHDNHRRWIDSVGQSPTLFFQARLFCRGKRDDLAPATICATVAITVLHGRQVEAWKFHAGCAFRFRDLE